jgi:hypothetical protein
MKERLKVFIIWVLLSLLLFNVGLGFFIFELSLLVNKNDIENFLTKSDEGNLLLLKISDSSSIIRNGEDEIVYEGRHYDVKREFRSDGTLYIYCVHDVKEERLIGSWKTTLSNSFPQSGKHGNQTLNIIKHLIKVYFHRDLSGESPGISDFDFASISDDKIPVQNYFCVISPPPEV